MPTRLESSTGKLELPFVFELSKNMVLLALQGQVKTPIDPESLAFDQQGFVWDEGDIVLAVTFRDRTGFAQGRVVVQPASSEELDVCFFADVRFVGYLASPGTA